MDKHISGALICFAVVSLAVIAVTAYPRTSATPLYVMRMEQASSKMNFLPTEMNPFTYTTEKGCVLNCDVATRYCSGARPCDTTPGDTCEPTCLKMTCYTCELSCYLSCWETCVIGTCEPTCNSFTCQYTCYTCDQPTCPETCEPTCEEPTCPVTC